MPLDVTRSWMCAFAALATACTSPAPVPEARPALLSELTHPVVVGYADRVLLDYDWTTRGECLSLAPRVVATVDGRPLPITERGSYARASCGGDCEAEGGDGRLQCNPPILRLTAPLTPPFTIELSDGATVFRVAVTGESETVIVDPPARPLAVGDRVTFRTKAVVADVQRPEIERVDGRSFSAMFFDQSSKKEEPDGVSFELRAGDCSDPASTVDARVALALALTVTKCEGGLVACHMTGRTAWQNVTLSTLRPGCPR